MVTACPVASLLQGGTREVKIPAQSAPGPGWRRMGRAWRSRTLLPKPLCSPFPQKSSAWGLQAVMGIAEPQLEGALQVQIHTHMCAHIHIGGAGTYIGMIYYVHTPAEAAGAVPSPAQRGRDSNTRLRGCTGTTAPSRQLPRNLAPRRARPLPEPPFHWSSSCQSAAEQQRIGRQGSGGCGRASCGRLCADLDMVSAGGGRSPGGACSGVHGRRVDAQAVPGGAHPGGTHSGVHARRLSRGVHTRGCMLGVLQGVHTRGAHTRGVPGGCTPRLSHDRGRGKQQPRHCWGFPSSPRLWGVGCRC